VLTYNLRIYTCKESLSLHVSHAQNFMQDAHARIVYVTKETVPKSYY